MRVWGFVGELVQEKGAMQGKCESVSELASGWGKPAGHLNFHSLCPPDTSCRLGCAYQHQGNLCLKDIIRGGVNVL